MSVLILQSFVDQKPIGRRGLSLGMDEIDFAERLHRYYEEGIPELDKPPIVRGETTVVVLQLEGYLKEPTTVACVAVLVYTVLIIQAAPLDRDGPQHAHQRRDSAQRLRRRLRLVVARRVLDGQRDPSDRRHAL